MKILQRILAVALLAISLVITATCANPIVQRSTVPVTTARFVEDGTVVVRNDNWSLMRVYMSTNGNAPVRLGTVETMRREVFKFRVVPGATYLFTLMPLAGSTGYTTDGVSVDSGDTISLYIANHLPFSTVVRNMR